MRPLNRPSNRTTIRWSTRLAPGARRPNYLVMGIRAHKKAQQSRRTLMRLAPSLFDTRVIDREAKARRADFDRLTEIDKALCEVYQISSSPMTETYERRTAREYLDHWMRLTPAARERIKLEETCYDVNFARGREMWRLHRLLRPHYVPTLHQIADLLEIATTYGAFATGMPLPNFR